MKLKYIFTSLLIALIVILLFNFNNYAQNYYVQNNKIISQLNRVKNSLLNFKYEVFVNSVYLYKNNDDLIKAVKELTDATKSVIKNRFLEDTFFDVYTKYIILDSMIKKKISHMYRFQTVNSGIKNSVIYLGDLLNSLQKMDIEDKEYIKNVTDVVTSVFLAKSSYDSDFIQNLHIEYFKNYKTEDEKLKKFNSILYENLILFKKYFPVYKAEISSITKNDDINYLKTIFAIYFEEMNSKLYVIKYVSWTLIAFALIAGLGLMLLMYKVEIEKEELKKLNDKIKTLLISDRLTGLYNRYKYDEDLKEMKNPVLVLVNIDNFKHYNDYFGTAMGDKILKKVAMRLKTIVPKELDAKFYRLGADDFGIVWEYEKNPDFKSITTKIISYFDNTSIEIDNEINVHISVSIGVSTTPPYLENADIALKHVKKSIRKKCLFYTETMSEKEIIGKNIQKAKILYEAIKNSRIVPYFQPIYNIKTLEIEKYEVLARLIRSDGRVESIFPYLQIAKDNKMYSDITKMIYKKSYEVFKNTDKHFSLNISIDDFNDSEIIKLIDRLFLQDENISKRVTFELLESEAIEDYNAVSEFISKAKKHGVSFAIDDFGSGYSNFTHILNLNIDIIKIDGSLIKNLEKDNFRNIVKFMSEFASYNNIKTVAEFVETREILETLKELGIDYAQGYYLSKPLPEI